VTAGWATGAPPLLVGLDVTRHALLGPAELELAARGATAAGRFLAGPLAHYAASYERSRRAPAGWAPCHDLVATVAAVDPALVTEAPTVPLAVVTGAPAARGTTIVDRRPDATTGAMPPGFAAWRVAPRADADRVRAAFRALVAGGAGTA
jgi:inosine-uridine nucleoside N-ribohydrolase